MTTGRIAGLFSALLLIWCGSRLVPASNAQVKADEAVCAVAHVDVLPPFTAEGAALLRRYQADARKDPGAVRVDVFEQLGRPNHSTIVSVFESRKAFDAHVAAEHTKAFRSRLQPMLGSPYDERLHRPMP